MPMNKTYEEGETQQLGFDLVMKPIVPPKIIAPFPVGL